MRKLLLLFVAIPALSIRLEAQYTGIPNETPDDLASHLMVYVAPIYPPIAQAAQITGDVVIKVELAPDGLVRSTKIISGPPMLRQAAMDAVKQWRYQPFQDKDGPISVIGNVSLSFTETASSKGFAVHTAHESTATGSYTETLTLAPSDEAIAQRYFPLFDICRTGVAAHKGDDDTVSACKQAVAISEEFAKDARFNERRLANVYAAAAYANAQETTVALVYSNQAVELLTPGHADAAASEGAYSTRGYLRALNGDLAGADADMTLAESYANKATMPANMANQALKNDLLLHAQVLDRLNRTTDAQEKRDEAAKL